LYNTSPNNALELVFLPMYGKKDHSKLAAEVLEYEINLLKKNKLDKDIVIATMITSNKIIEEDQLKKYYEEVKNMLDILNIAREDGMQEGMQEGMRKGRQEGKVEMARVLKQDGADFAMISRASGLSAQEITRL
jgi:predicted transposase/invertase (TIGR01784 family)